MHCDQMPQAPAALSSLDYEPEQTSTHLSVFVLGPSSKRVDEPTHQLLHIQTRKVTNGGHVPTAMTTDSLLSNQQRRALTKAKQTKKKTNTNYREFAQ